MGSKFLNRLGKELLVFDGAMGTMIQSAGATIPHIPEEINILNPDVIKDIYKKYISAGSDIISANTFGANNYKLENSEYSIKEIVDGALNIAKEAVAEGGRDTLVAYDMGPIGVMMKPIGTLSFENAYEIFKEQVLLLDESLVDVVIIETMTDISELRAAILAVKENSNLPVIASMSFNEDGRTLMGTDPETMVYILEGLSVDVLGVNCSMGPVELSPLVKRILAVSNTPVIVQANAGLPANVNGQTIFSLGSDEYTESIKELIVSGASIIGGCCGTTPEYIQKISGLRNLYAGFEKKDRVRGNFICSSTKSVCIDDTITIIGERINPSGNKKLKVAFLEGRYEYATNVAFEQINNGAAILDVNTSLPQIDELEYMKNIIDTFNGLIDTPLQIDSTKSVVVEEALRRYPGISIVNSVSGKQSSMDKLFPIIKKYGAYAVGLCLDEEGIPKTAQQRFDIAEKIILNAKKHGIPEDRLLIDTLVLTASAQQSEVMETVKAISLIKAKYNVKTTLGVSNVSYGLPYRGLINRVFFTMALTAGLDTAIIDPSADGIIDTVKAFNVLSNKDQGATEYIEYNENKPEKEAPVKVKSEKKEAGKVDSIGALGEKNLHTYLLEGDEAEVLNTTKSLLSDNSPLDIVNNHLIPALDNIGNLYETRAIYLPQLIRAAETVKIAFALIKETLEKETTDFKSKGSIIMATVKGDVHDIGKNLVKIMLESYGYKVVDLGKDVPAEDVIEAINKHDIKMIGLSALMTTTVNSMEEIIKEVREKTEDVKIFVGGAVLTEDYSKKIGADFYCKDARESVLVANEYFK